MHKLALMLRHLPLPMRDAYTFAISPADPDDPIISSALLSFATAYCQRCAVICCYCSKVANVYLPTPSLMDGHARRSHSLICQANMRQVSDKVERFAHPLFALCKASSNHGGRLARARHEMIMHLSN